MKTIYCQNDNLSGNAKIAGNDFVSHFHILLWLHSCFSSTLEQDQNPSDGDGSQCKTERETVGGQNSNGRTATVCLKHPGLLLQAQLFLAYWGYVLSTSEIYSSSSYFVSLSLLNRPPSSFLPPLSFNLPLQGTCGDMRPSADVPLKYAGLNRANRSLTFCLTVQCILFPKGSIKL